MDQFQVSDKAESLVDLKVYFYLVRSRLWLILLAGLLVGIIAFLVSIIIKPNYEASTRLLISSPPTLSGFETSTLINTLTQTNTYSKMLVDRPVLQGVIDKLNLQTTTEKLLKKITVELVVNTQLILVIVEDPNPYQAADIANTIAIVFSDRIRELQSQRYKSTQNDLSQQIAEMEQQLIEISTLIDREFNVDQKVQLEARKAEYQRIYMNLLTSYEQLRLADAQTSTNIFVSEPAIPPIKPMSPKILLNTLLASIVGILLAVGFVFASNLLDDTIRNPEEIRTRFKLPVLGIIPFHKEADEKLICRVDPRSPVTESFRILRTNLAFASVDMPLHRIIVTSSVPSEGKTTISSNLAIVIAQAEKRVLLVDADMRRPRIHNKFNILNRIGLSDLFVRTSHDLFDGVIQTCEVPMLSIITSGRLPPNPSELLISKKMTQIFENLSQDYDLTLIDTPPLLIVTDSAALSTKTDGVLIVIKPGTTKLSDLEQSLEQLRKVGARVLGVVINEVDPHNRKYGYYYQDNNSKYSNYYSAVE
jgi:capsular exopolysaccharide synthesis family protein